MSIMSVVAQRHRWLRTSLVKKIRVRMLDPWGSFFDEGLSIRRIQDPRGKSTPKDSSQETMREICSSLRSSCSSGPVNFTKLIGWTTILMLGRSDISTLGSVVMERE